MKLTNENSKKITEMLLDETLYKLNTSIEFDYPKSFSNRILFLGGIEDFDNTIPKHLQNEKKRKWTNDGEFKKVLKIQFVDGRYIIVVFVDSLQPVLHGYRFEAIIAPTYSLERLQKENIDLGIMANYYITKGEN